MILTRGIYSLSNFSIRFEQYEAVESENSYITTKMIYPVEREAIAYFDKEKEGKIEHISPNFHPFIETFITENRILGKMPEEEASMELIIKRCFQNWFLTKYYNLKDVEYEQTLPLTEIEKAEEGIDKE